MQRTAHLPGLASQLLLALLACLLAMPELLNAAYKAVQCIEGALGQTEAQRAGYCGMRHQQDALQNHRKAL